MKNSHTKDSRLTFTANQPRSLLLVVISACMLFTIGLSACGGNLPFTAAADSLTQTSSASTLTTANYPVKVFFSRFPVSVNTNFSAVFPVNRTSPTTSTGTFSLQLLIAGPTPSEKQAGYFTELNTMLSGPSNCAAPLPVGGPDFKLSLNKKGTVTETGTATVKFCRSTTSAGIGADARVKAEITATLKQFAGIKKVVILTKNGHCFGDLSGQDICLH